MSNPTPPSYHVEREPARSRRRILVTVLAAAVLLIGGGAAYAATRGGHHHAAAGPQASASGTPAATERPTCEQFLAAYTGGYDLGEPPNDWAGHLLAGLIGDDGIAMQLDGITQFHFAMDLNEACLDPKVRNVPARAVGGDLYRADKAKYTKRQ